MPQFHLLIYTRVLPPTPRPTPRLRSRSSPARIAALPSFANFATERGFAVAHELREQPVVG